MAESRITATRGMPAPQEIAFGVATDPAHLPRWFPVADGAESFDAGAMDLDGSTCTATWQYAGHRGLLVARDAEAGSSEVRLELEFEDGAPEGTQQRAEEALDRLVGEVLVRTADAS